MFRWRPSKYRLPENLYIVGAMNTSDRSVIQIDSAAQICVYRVETMLVKKSLYLISALRSATMPQNSGLWRTYWTSEGGFWRLYSLMNPRILSRRHAGPFYLWFEVLQVEIVETQPQGQRRWTSRRRWSAWGSSRGWSASWREPAGDNIDEAEGQELNEHEDCFWSHPWHAFTRLVSSLADTVAATVLVTNMSRSSTTTSDR